MKFSEYIKQNSTNESNNKQSLKFSEWVNQYVTEQAQQAALAKAQSDYTYATTPIAPTADPTLRKLKGQNANTLQFNPIAPEGAPVDPDSGVRLVSKEVYDAAKEEQERQSTNYQLKTEMEKAEKEYNEVKGLNGDAIEELGVKTALSLKFGDSTLTEKDIAKEKYLSATEVYYQNLYNTDADLTTIFYSLQQQKKETTDETVKAELDKDADKISKLLYGNTAVDDYLGSNVLAGAGGISSGITATLDATAGNILKLFGWENNPISAWNESVQSSYNYWAQRGNNAGVAIGDSGNWGGRIIQALIGVIPDALLAVMTRGSSLPTSATLRAVAGAGIKASTANLVRQTAALEGKLSPIASIASKSKVVADAAGTALKTTAKNPMYWTSFTRTFGTDYEAAKEKGADEGKAYLYALVTSTMNSLVEVGGGIQVLPSRLQNKTKSQILDWIKSALEEGREEVVQSIISEMNEKLMYDYDKEILSLTDEDAVINPQRIAGEFALGTAVGGIAGGGQVIASNASTAQYTRVGKSVRNSLNIQDLISYAQKSSNENIRTIATENTAEKISDKDLGILYGYAVRDVDAAFNSVSDIEGVNRVLGELAKENNSQTLNNIILSRYVNRLDSIDPQTVSGYNNDTNVNQDDGGNVNAGQGTLHNGSERTGRALSDTQVEFGEVQEADGGIQTDSREGWGNSGTLRNQGDNRGVTLAPEQKERYTAAILRYKSSESYKINAKLREDEALTEEEQEFVNTLDEALEQLPTYEGTVYRQIIFDDFGEVLFNQFLQEHSPGQIVSYPSFTSCSTTHDGYTVEGDYKVQLVVEGKSARNVDGYGNNMENEVVFARDSTFIVKNIDTNGQVPIIYLQEVFENGYNTTEEHSNAVQHMQTPDTIHGNMQGVSKENTEGNHIRQVRPQSAASGGQRNTVRAGGEQETLLSAEGEKQEVSSDTDTQTDGESAGVRMMDLPAISVKVQNFVKSVGKALGRNVEFVNMEKFLKEHDINTEKLKIYPEGAIDGKGNIYLWYNAEKPVQFLFKHELTHFGERSKYCKQFVEVVRSSKVYLEWLKKTTKMEGASREVMEAALMKKHREAQSGLTSLGYDGAMAEVIADFVGEKCFGESLEDMNKLVASVKDVKERNAVVRFLHDFFLWLKNKLVSIGAIKNEISVIEQNFARMIADADNTKTPDTKDGGLKYSIVGDAVFSDYCDSIDKIESSDDISHKGQYIEVSQQTPSIIVEKANAKNLPMAIQFDIAYLETRHDGKLEGNYHNLGANNMKELPKLLETPEYIVQLQNGRLNVIVDMSTKKGERALVSIELEQAKQVNGKFNKYNLILTAFGAKTGYLERIVNNPENQILYDRKTEPQGTDQLHKGLDGINDSVSNNRVTQNEPVVKNNSMQEGENYSSEKNGLKFSVPTATESDTDTESTDFTAEFKGLMQSFKNGEISQDEYMRRVSELYQESINENGQISQGKMVAPENKPFAVPKSVKEGTEVRQTVRTILESGRATPEQENVFKEKILDDKFSLTPTSNEANIKKAEEDIEKEGYQKAKENWFQSVADWAADADTVAKGEALLQLAFEQKNTVDIVNLAAQLAELGTRIGQALQAMSLIKRMGGLGQLVYLERCVARINKSLEKKIKKGKAEIVKIDETLAQQLAESKTEAEFEITYAAIVKDIAAQVPPTFADQWNAMRYVCMLLNPVTHIRNIVGNAIFLPGVRIKDLLAVAMEKGVSKDKRTKVVKVKKEYQEYAEKDFDQVKDLITGTGKYNPSDEIRSNQRIFKPNWLEAARKFNFDLLEKEDALFLKRHYKHALGGYLQAQGIDLREVTPTQLTKAREYAMQEAMKATYRDASKAANMISRFAKTNAATEIFVEGLLPYKKTPINIIKRGIEYSPIGLIKTLSKGIYDLHKGNIATTQFIDGLASGLTGTGICIVGALLASLGVVKGGFDDEEKWFRKLNGEQEYSIEIGGVSYTIDWATPASIPLFLGVAIAEYDADEDADILSSIWDFGMASFEPLLNLSLLSGLEDAIEAVSYADDGEKITSFLGTTMESYFAQFLPSVFGKTANLFDDTRRTTYIDRTSKFPVVMQEAWNKVAAKLPIVSQTRAEYIDAWGETQYTGNFVQRFFQQFVSPGYASIVNVDDVSEELMRLYRQTDVSGIFPSTPQKYFKIRGERRDLSKEEYFDYATFKGQTQADLVDEAIHSEEYAALTDEQKAEVIKDIYSYAGALAKCQLDYTYEEVAAMEGEDTKGNLILTEEKYNRLNDKARQILIDEYFMESCGNVKAYKTAKNGRSVVEYFCKKVKDN